MVNLVSIDDDKYMVDVGFGANNPASPLKLTRDSHAVTAGVGPALNRLSYESLPAHTNSGQRVWVFEHKDGEGEGEWLPMYCFVELEFLPRDYEVMNYFTATSGESWFTRRVVACRMVEEERERDEEGKEGTRLGGVVMLVGGEVTRRLKGKKETVMVCETEEERVEALERWFGVRLSEEEKAGVRGKEVELKKA